MIFSALFEAIVRVDTAEASGPVSQGTGQTEIKALTKSRKQLM